MTINSDIVAAECQFICKFKKGLGSLVSLFQRDGSQTSCTHLNWLRLIAACWQFVCIYKLDQSKSDHSCLDTGCLSPGDLCIRPVKVIPQRLRVLNVHSLSNQLVAATTCSWLPNAKKSHPITQPPLIFFQVVRRLASYFYSVVTELFKEGGRELKCDPKHQGIR